MTSYNSIDGIPSTMNKEYLTDILRKEWGFKGFTVSDLYSIEGIKSSHFITETVQQAAINAMEAGTM
jgi:beta-glucosidase